MSHLNRTMAPARSHNEQTAVQYGCSQGQAWDWHSSPVLARGHLLVRRVHEADESLVEHLMSRTISFLVYSGQSGRFE